MRTSELVKQLFALMSKHGDLNVVGEAILIGKEIHLKEVGLTEEDSTILPGILDDTYL